MQLVLFSRKYPEPGQPLIRDWDLSQRDMIIGEISKDGTLCLISESSYKLLADDLAGMKFINCQIKKEKIELYRALRLHILKERRLPRRLIFPAGDRGALKRSVEKFYADRYLVSDPACLIILTDEMHAQVLEDYTPAKGKKNGRTREKGEDPIRELLAETAGNPIIEAVSNVFIGTSFDMRLARLLILKASQTTSPVLILGESGTGKDVIAKQIAGYTLRYRESFVTVNCAALPETLLEGELFGYRKGSFSGADSNKTGLFEAHRGGIIFLDEIGDLSLANQAKLLLAIDSKTIRPIGANKNIEVDVRVIAATNRNIDYMAMHGRFREDLLHRLNVMRITAPPLRTHPEDIPDIADSIWKKLNPGSRLSLEFKQHLQSYPWPGNVRELKSLLTSIMDLFGGISPTPAHIEAIRNSRRESMINLMNNPGDDKAQLLKLEARMRLTSLQNIVRGVKVTMRPVINREFTADTFADKSATIRQFISRQVDLIDTICREPVYFKDIKLFRETTRYRYLLEKMVRRWPSSPEELLNNWSGELQKLDDDITLGILEMIWGKIDM